MKKLTPDSYEALRSQIHNKEVPNLFHSMLLKQSANISTQEAELDKRASTLIDLFNMFFRQYNTILVLSKKVSHVGYPDTHYLDTTSINTLIRSCHERFLALWYLSCHGLFNRTTSDKEKEFKWLCFYHGGLMDSIRNMRYRSKLVDTSQVMQTHEFDKKAREATLTKIKSHPIFLRLEEKAKLEIEQLGAWRIVGKKSASWTELARKSPLNSAMAQYEYHTMSMYTHPSEAGLAADAMHDGNIDGLLAYLYALSALYITTIDEIFPFSTDTFTPRELACVTEILEIAKDWLALPPLPAWNI